MKAISERQSRLLAQAIASPVGAVPLGRGGPSPAPGIVLQRPCATA